MDVFDLAAKLTLDTGDFESGLSESQSSASTFANKVTGGLKRVGKVAAVSLAAAATAVGALGAAFLDGVTAVAEHGDAIDKASQKLGFSSTAYQEWDFILQHCGTSIDTLQTGMRTLEKAAENNSDAFSELGISQEELQSMSPEELFEATVSALQGVDDETERSRLAMELFGKTGMELGPLLNASAADVEAMKEEVHALGGVMSEEAVANAATFQDTLQNLQTAFEGLKTSLTADFLPAVTTVMQGLTDIFTGNGEAGLSKISEGIDMIVTGITEKLPELLELGTEIVTSLLTAIIENLPQLLECGAQVLGELVAGIVAAIPTLVAMLPEIIAAIVTGLAAAGPEILQAGVDLLNMLIDGASSVVASAVDIGSSIVSSISEGIGTAWNGLLTAITTLGSTIMTSLSSGISSAWETVTSTITTLTSGVVALFEKPFNDAKDAVGKVIDTIKGFLDFKFELPSIPLPHFGISPAGWKVGDLLKGVIPKLDIQWYAKAYDNPYVFNKPTLMGFGDGAGGEMVYGHDNLMRDIRAANDSEGIEKRLDDLIDIMEDIARNGLNANISGSALYRSVTDTNRKRTRATNYNALAAAY